MSSGEDNANAALLAERRSMSTKISELESRVSSLEKDKKKIEDEKSTLETSVKVYILVQF